MADTLRKARKSKLLQWGEKYLILIFFMLLLEK
jgi:hypothetical protein